MWSKKSKYGGINIRKRSLLQCKETCDMDANLINQYGSETLIKYAKSRLIKNIKQTGNKSYQK